MRKLSFVLLLSMAACQAPLRSAEAVETYCESYVDYYGNLQTRCRSWESGYEVQQRFQREQWERQREDRRDCYQSARTSFDRSVCADIGGQQQ